MVVAYARCSSAHRAFLLPFESGYRPIFLPFEPSHLPTNSIPTRGARCDLAGRVCCHTEFRHLEMFLLHADRLRTLYYEEEMGLNRSCSDLVLGFGFWGRRLRCVSVSGVGTRKIGRLHGRIQTVWIAVRKFILPGRK